MFSKLIPQIVTTKDRLNSQYSSMDILTTIVHLILHKVCISNQLCLPEPLCYSTPPIMLHGLPILTFAQYRIIATNHFLAFLKVSTSIILIQSIINASPICIPKVPVTISMIESTSLIKHSLLTAVSYL